MTTPAFNRRAGPTAQAMNIAYQKATAGEREGKFACTKCNGGTIKFTAQQPHQTVGRCSTTGCVRWP